MSSRQIAILALVAALPAPGCCTLAQLFCGPDDSEWVQIGFRTPREGLATFMEAVLKDDCQVVYDSLAETFKEQEGLDSLATACIFWERLKEEQSGLHLLGYAEVTELEAPEFQAAYELEYSGYRFRVELVRQQLWAIFTSMDNVPELSRFAEVFDPASDPATRVGVVQWPREDGENVVIVLPDPGLLGPVVPLDMVQEISISREWKVHSFAQIVDAD